MDVEDVAEAAWEAAARREAAVRRLVALPDGERTRKAFALEAKRLGVSVATMFRLVAAWRREPVRQCCCLDIVGRRVVNSDALG